MRNIKLTIEYEGTRYSGWQVQRTGKTANCTHKKTIQQVLEEALARILQEKVRLIASGRTDAGVHARGQVANFKTNSQLNCGNIQRGLNSILPADIRISRAEEVAADFHARFSARSKLYRYTIVNNSFLSPHLQRFCYLVKYPLDVGKMCRTRQYFLGRHDFRSFRAVDKKDRDALRTIQRLNIHRKGDLIYLVIEGDGFLYRMVRNIVGTLIEVGRGKLKPQEIKEILKAKNRIFAGPCAPAKGLSLEQVHYKKNKSSLDSIYI